MAGDFARNNISKDFFSAIVLPVKAVVVGHGCHGAALIRRKCQITKKILNHIPGSISLTILLGWLCSSCPSRATSQVIVWGDNFNHQTNVPASATNVIALAAGDYHCLALRADGTVVAWGNNQSGQTNVPPDLTNAVSVAAGSTHSLALRRDGTLTAWGKFIYFNPITVTPEATNVVALALGPGAQHALVLRADGTVVDWGNSYYGLINIPPTARNIVSVAAGSYHSVALRSDGQVVAWGNNSKGQLNVPANATNIVAIAAGWYGNAALRADGTILVWGTVSSTSSGFTNVVDLTCPFSDQYFYSYLLALRGNGTLVENPVTIGPERVPANATNVAAIAAGSYDGLALVGGGPPVFPGIPANRTVTVGATAFLRLVAVGALPLSYQWSCNGTNIPGATNTVLVLTNVQPGQAGTCYSLTASNLFDTATSAPITLNEVASEVFIQPQTFSAPAGAPVTFIATATGQGPFSYQWVFGGTNLDGATNASLTLSNVQPANAGNYSVMVTNSYGTVTANASLAVQPLAFNAGSILLLTTNGVQLQLDGVFATQSVIIHASTNLASWLPILTNPPATGSVLFLDSSATNLPQRFYRATEQ